MEHKLRTVDPEVLMEQLAEMLQQAQAVASESYGYMNAVLKGMNAR